MKPAALPRTGILIALLMFVFLISAAMVYGVVGMHLLLSFRPSDVPAITANPVEASAVFSISKFRSDAGHDYSMGAWDGESCRSMKHYFNWSQDTENNMPVRSLPSAGHPNIAIYAPFDGTVTAIQSEQINLGKQVFIASRKNPSFYVRLFHVDTLPGITVGATVTSGEQVGTIGPMDGTDVSYEAHVFPMRTVYLSIFDYMSPEAFAPYAALGHKPSDFILSRQDADALGYQCSGEQFVRPQDFYSQPGSKMEGYVSLRRNPYENLYNRMGTNGQNFNTQGFSNQQPNH